MVTVNINSETKVYSKQEYLDFEVESELRHEFRDGEIIEMSGGTPNHNQIVSNCNAILNFALRPQPYWTFVTDQRLWIPDANCYTYPDIMVIREPLELQAGRTDTVMNPIFIAEILSKSTSNYDRGEKFEFYRTIPTFIEYLTINQYTPHLQHYLKTEQGWLLRDIKGLDGSLLLESIGVELALADLFYKVNFPTEN